MPANIGAPARNRRASANCIVGLKIMPTSSGPIAARRTSARWRCPARHVEREQSRPDEGLLAEAAKPRGPAPWAHARSTAFSVITAARSRQRSLSRPIPTPHRLLLPPRMDSAPIRCTSPHGPLRTPHRPAHRGRGSHGVRQQGRRAVSRAAGAGRHRPRPLTDRRAGHPARSRTGAHPVRGAGDRRRGVQRVAAGPAGKLDPDLLAGAGRGGADRRRRCRRGAPARARPAVAGSHRAGRHRRAA